MLDNKDLELLAHTSDLHSVPMGAYNIRKNGEAVERKSTPNIDIETDPKTGGLIVSIRPNTKNESVHIPVILTKAGLTDVVYNEFRVGAGADVTIVAGCGMHTTQKTKTEHSGTHKFVLGKNSRVRYIERHLVLGGKSDAVFNPKTEIELGVGAEMTIETTQTAGVTSAIRKTIAKLKDNSKLNITEKVLTEGKSMAESSFVADLEGKDSNIHIVSRAVAKDESRQFFNSTINGLNKSFGHTECDAIIVGKAQVFARPEVNALHPDSALVHEAAIGKIAGEQIQKLLTLGLTEEEAQNQILKGFLR